MYDKKGELKKENFDASDALVTCLAICNKIEFGEAEFNITSSDNVKSSEISYLMEVWDKKYQKRLLLIENKLYICSKKKSIY